MLSPVLLAFFLRFLSFISDASAQNQPVGTPSNYWVANVQRQGTVAFGNASYPVFRNVKAYGAKGQLPVILDSLSKTDTVRRWHNR
jgi:glucan 1,3-beta-glucosidase